MRSRFLHFYYTQVRGASDVGAYAPTDSWPVELGVPIAASAKDSTIPSMVKTLALPIMARFSCNSSSVKKADDGAGGASLFR